MYVNVTTWRDIREYLNMLNDSQLDQPAELLPPTSSDAIIPLHYAIAMGTVSELEADARSSDDNRCHPERVVLLYD